MAGRGCKLLSQKSPKTNPLIECLSSTNIEALRVFLDMLLHMSSVVTPSPRRVAITDKSDKWLSAIVDCKKDLNLHNKKNDLSTSALVVGKVYAI